ncbi:MAG: pirin family protein [Candidimonas sp.]|nr:MAG: pirin family protein [Candidimonas sp.]
MIERRPFDALGGADHGWLNTHHHFSFANYFDPNRVHWGVLRVWNDDTIQPGTGFPLHPHADMEIITYVREGAITHRDNLGNEGRTEAGDVQVMSAGTGIVHSEYNREAGITKIFQIWVMPNQRGQQPSWGARPFPKHDRAGRFVVLASGLAGDDETLRLRADARVLGATLDPAQRLAYRFADGERYGYLVPATGRLTVNGVTLDAGDGAAIHGEDSIHIEAVEPSDFILVDAAADQSVTRWNAL